MSAGCTKCLYARVQVMMYNTYRDGMDVSVKHLVPEKLPPFVLKKASDAQQAAKAITKAAEVRIVEPLLNNGLSCNISRQISCFR